MKKFEKLILEAESGISFELEETGETLTIRAVNSSVRDVLDDHSDDYVANYENPPVPSGYKYVCGEWNSGFVIERVVDGSQFVWIPVGYVRKETDCKNFFEKFKFEDLTDNDMASKHQEENESIKKYGGFYISRFNISEKNGMPQSVKGAMPWVNLNGKKACEIASSFEKSENVMSHLTLDAEYGYICYWLVFSGAKTLAEVTEDSSTWGNFKRGGNAETGSCEEWCANNIFDVAGNVSEFVLRPTSEREVFTRGGNRYRCRPRYLRNAVCFFCRGSYNKGTNYIGFRIALCIK